MPMVSIKDLWEGIYGRSTGVLMKNQLFLIPHQWLKDLPINEEY